MLRTFLTIGLAICCLCIKAQQISKKEAGARGLQSTFAAPVLAAYQENAKNKVEDLFQYFQLLSDTVASVELKKEVEKNIYLLFKGKDILLPDFLNNAKNEIKLSSFIEQLKKRQLKFKPLRFEDGPILFDSWETTYEIQMMDSKGARSLSLTQTVYLSNEVKTFGSTTKNVWELYLGRIQ